LISRTRAKNELVAYFSRFNIKIFANEERRNIAALLVTTGRTSRLIGIVPSSVYRRALLLNMEDLYGMTDVGCVPFSEQQFRSYYANKAVNICSASLKSSSE
jgi:hypothetical protein